MLKVNDFYNILNELGITKFSGVPDSLLKDICAYISDNTDNDDHKITANEGSAISLAVGQYLATGKPSLVYMQNSGFGNALNPLLSLADSKVYGIPMLLMVGWRGEPGTIDEPQHIKQGEIMENLLDACNIPSIIIDKDIPDIKETLSRAINISLDKMQPIVLLIKKNTFTKYELKNKIADISNNSREDAIDMIVESSEPDDIFVSTTGMASRELFEIRVKKNQPHENDFLTVGSMGHASMIALGIAENHEKHVFCIDGDGSSLMHLGNFSSIGQSKTKNLIHIILNNAAHDSVGGQPTTAQVISLPKIAESCGYKTMHSIEDIKRLKSLICDLKESNGPHLLEIKVSKGSRRNLGRPTSTPIQNKIALMQKLVK